MNGVRLKLHPVALGKYFITGMYVKRDYTHPRGYMSESKEFMLFDRMPLLNLTPNHPDTQQPLTGAAYKR